MNLFTGRQARPQASINSLKWLWISCQILLLSSFVLLSGCGGGDSSSSSTSSTTNTNPSQTTDSTTTESISRFALYQGVQYLRTAKGIDPRQQEAALLKISGIDKATCSGYQCKFSSGGIPHLYIYPSEESTTSLSTASVSSDISSSPIIGEPTKRISLSPNNNGYSTLQFSANPVCPTQKQKKALILNASLGTYFYKDATGKISEDTYTNATEEGYLIEYQKHLEFLGYEVDIKKGANHEAFELMRNGEYGVVIIDTHGGEDGELLVHTKTDSTCNTKDKDGKIVSYPCFSEEFKKKLVGVEDYTGMNVHNNPPEYSFLSILPTWWATNKIAQVADSANRLYLFTACHSFAQPSGQSHALRKYFEDNKLNGVGYLHTVSANDGINKKDGLQVLGVGTYLNTILDNFGYDNQTGYVSPKNFKQSVDSATTKFGDVKFCNNAELDDVPDGIINWDETTRWCAVRLGNPDLYISRDVCSPTPKTQVCANNSCSDKEIRINSKDIASYSINPISPNTAIKRPVSSCAVYTYREDKKTLVRTDPCETNRDSTIANINFATAGTFYVWTEAKYQGWASDESVKSNEVKIVATGITTTLPSPTISNVQVQPTSFKAGDTVQITWQSTNQQWFFFYLYDINKNPVNTGAFLSFKCKEAQTQTGKDTAQEGCLWQEHNNQFVKNQYSSWTVPSELPVGQYLIRVAIWSEPDNSAGAFSNPFTRGTIVENNNQRPTVDSLNAPATVKVNTPFSISYSYSDPDGLSDVKWHYIAMSDNTSYVVAYPLNNNTGTLQTQSEWMFPNIGRQQWIEVSVEDSAGNRSAAKRAYVDVVQETTTTTDTPTPTLSSLTGTWIGSWTIEPFTESGLRQAIKNNEADLMTVMLMQGTDGKLSGTLSITDADCFSGGRIEGTVGGESIKFGSVDGKLSYTGTVYRSNKYIYGEWSTSLPCTYKKGYWGIILP